MTDNDDLKNVNDTQDRDYGSASSSTNHAPKEKPEAPPGASGDNKTYYSVKLSDLNASYVGCDIEFSAQVISIETQLVYPEKIDIICNCGSVSSITLKLPNIIQNNHFNGIAKTTLEELWCGGCKKKGKMNAEVIKHGDLWILELQDTVQMAQKQMVNRKPVKVYYSPMDTLYELSGIVKVRGKLISHKTKTFQDMVIVADDIQQDTQYFEQYKPSEKDLEEFKTFSFDSFTELKKQSGDTLNPFIVDRNFEKAVSDLAVHSKLRNGDVDTTINLLKVGDSRTGKSQIDEDLIVNLCPTGSEWINAEAAARTGVAYSIETIGDRRILKWGALVTSDRMACALDGLNAWNTNDNNYLIQVREILRGRKVKVNKIVKGQAWARTRILAAANGRKMVKEYPTKFRALMSSFNRIDLNRYDLFLVFGDNDVEQSKIDEAEEKKGKTGIPKRYFSPELYKKHLMYCWQDHPLEWEADVSKYWIGQLAAWRETYLQDKKLFSNEFTKSTCKWLFAIAQRDHSFVNDRLIIKRKHVDILFEMLAEWCEHLEINKELALIATVSISDIESLHGFIANSDNRMAIFRAIADKQPISQKAITELLKMDKGNVSKLVNELKDKDLLETTPEGLLLSDLGNKVLQAVLKNTLVAQEINQKGGCI